LGTRQKDSLPSAAFGKIRHSTKIVAECRALGKEMHSAKKVFAENPAFGKDLHSAKTTSPDGKHPTVILCRVLAVRHSAKFFKLLCRVPDTRQRILIFFFLHPKFFAALLQY
jgi:hypothetical protein